MNAFFDKVTSNTINSNQKYVIGLEYTYFFMHGEA